MPKIKFNHEESDAFKSIGLIQETSAKNISNAFDSLDDLGEETTISRATEVLVTKLNKTEIAYVAVQALTNLQKLTAQLDMVRSVVFSTAKEQE